MNKLVGRVTVVAGGPRVTVVGPGGITGPAGPAGATGPTGPTGPAGAAADLGAFSWKTAVRVATTAAGTLATAFANGQTVDGVTLATGDRILIKNQGDLKENGIYVVAASGTPTRATDADAGSELVGAVVSVVTGATAGGKAFRCVNTSITLGSTLIQFEDLLVSLGALIAANNFSDLANASTARTNLGLGAASNVTFNTLTVSSVTGNASSATTAGYATAAGSATYASSAGTAGTANYANSATTATTVSGNAATATAMQNTRTIGGSNFNGTANVTSFPSPGAIGGTTPSTGAFTTLTTTGGIELGHATDTTITRTSAGNIAVEGNTIYRAGGTDVAVADGGTGASSWTSGAPVYASGTTTLASFASVAYSTTTANVAVTNSATGVIPLRIDGISGTSVPLMDVRLNGASRFQFTSGGLIAIIDSSGSTNLGYFVGDSLNGGIASRPGTDNFPGFTVCATSNFNVNAFQVSQTLGGNVYYALDKRGRPVTGNTTPTVAAGAGAGTSPTISVAGTDSVHVVSLTTGTSPTTSAAVFTLTVSSAYAAAPKIVIITPANAAAAALSGGARVFVDNTNNTTTTYRADVGATGLAASTAYKWSVTIHG